MDEILYEEKLEQQREEEKISDAAENIISFIRDNNELCKRAYDYYKEFKDHRERYIQPPHKCTNKEIESTFKGTNVLVITANKIENAIFLHWLSDKTGGPLKTLRINSNYYTIGNIDRLTIVHINTIRTGEEHTRRALNRVRKIFTPDYVFMLGVCYGLADMDKYPIGSVFASDTIKTFRLNFRDEKDSDDIFFEAEEEDSKSPNKGLIESIEGCWNLMQTKSILTNVPPIHIAQTKVGKFLSSNSLMDSRKVKQAVLKQHAVAKPKPLGGEMEGAGILKSYLVEEDEFDKWMVIKSICDWGEKKNSITPDADKMDKIKDSLQAVAMSNTCGAFENILTIL